MVILVDVQPPASGIYPASPPTQCRRFPHARRRTSSASGTLNRHLPSRQSLAVASWFPVVVGGGEPLHPASPGLLLACHRHKGSLRPWPGRLARPRPRCVLACLPACLPSAWSPAASAATSCLFSHHPPQGAPPPKTTGPRRSGGRPIQVRGREGSTADCRLIIRAGGIRGGSTHTHTHLAGGPHNGSVARFGVLLVSCRRAHPKAVA